MKNTLLCTSLLAIGLLGGRAMAQTRGGETPRSREQAAQPGKGLNALDDERVLTEIAGRGLSDLLAHAMEREGVPEHRRRALLARISLNRLMTGEPLSTAEMTARAERWRPHRAAAALRLWTQAPTG